MGAVCVSARGNEKDEQLTPTQFDHIICLQNLYMKGSIKKEQIEQIYIGLNYDDWDKEKNNSKKKSRFFKWYNMSKTAVVDVFSGKKADELLKPYNELTFIQEQSIAGDNNINTQLKKISISKSEQGLRNYYGKFDMHFQERLIKGPPSSFRFLAWVVTGELPDNRPEIYYKNLLSKDIDANVDIQIKKDLDRTIPLDKLEKTGIRDSLYRVLKALAIVDKELGYVQGMNFICSYILIVSGNNEVDSFYLMMSLLSYTFSYKFGLRHFYTEKFPLLNACTKIFNSHLQSEFEDVAEHIKQLSLPETSWISSWMIQIFFGVFPDETLMRIWDAFFIEGLPFLISFGLALVDLMSADILEINDLGELMEYFKLLNPELKSEIKDKERVIEYNIEQLIDKARNEFLIDYEEIENEIDHNYPDAKNNMIYDYKIDCPDENNAIEIKQVEPEEQENGELNKQVEAKLSVEGVSGNIDSHVQNENQDPNEQMIINTNKNNIQNENQDPNIQMQINTNKNDLQYENNDLLKERADSNEKLGEVGENKDIDNVEIKKDYASSNINPEQNDVSADISDNLNVGKGEVTVQSNIGKDSNFNYNKDGESNNLNMNDINKLLGIKQEDGNNNDGNKLNQIQETNTSKYNNNDNLSASSGNINRNENNADQNLNISNNNMNNGFNIDGHLTDNNLNNIRIDEKDELRKMNQGKTFDYNEDIDIEDDEFEVSDEDIGDFSSGIKSLIERTDIARVMPAKQRLIKSSFK